MFSERKNGNGLKESITCYATKRLWAIVKFYEIYEEINFKYFIENIEHFIKKYHFDWPEGKPYPKYSTAQAWPSKYDYDECVRCYEHKQLQINTQKVESIHDKKYYKDTLDDFKNYDAYNDLIYQELQKEDPDVNLIEKLEKLKGLSWERNRKRAGKDVQKVEGNIKNETTTHVEGKVNMIDDNLYEVLNHAFNRRRE